MRLFRSNKNGNTDMITMAITAAIMFGIAIILIYSTISGTDLKTAQDNINKDIYGRVPGMGTNASYEAYNVSTPVKNSTNSLLTQVNSFFAIGPIYLIVIVAVGIISALLYLRQQKT